MTMPAATERDAYEPAPPQLARAQALRRFNRIFVLLPVTLFGTAVLVMIGLLLWGSLSPNIKGTREFASALADIVLIFTIVPMTLLCAVVPTAAIAFAVYRRQGEKRIHGRFQTLLWRLESLLIRVQKRSEDVTDRAAGTVIEGHAGAAFVAALAEQVKDTIKRRNWS